jgi:hypothetical protein
MRLEQKSQVKQAYNFCTRKEDVALFGINFKLAKKRRSLP